MFEIARERAKEGGKKEEEIKEEEEEEEEDSDFLAPFLKSDQPTKVIQTALLSINWPFSLYFLFRCATQEEALRAEKACRRALKERLVERVNIIRRRLDEENEKLHKKQVSVHPLLWLCELQLRFLALWGCCVSHALSL